MGKPKPKDPRGTAPATPETKAPEQASGGPASAPQTGAAAHGPDGTPTRARKRIEEEKVKRTVHTAFRLTLDDGTVVPYAKGEHEMPVSHAEHFYTKHHLVDDE